MIYSKVIEILRHWHYPVWGCRPFAFIRLGLSRAASCGPSPCFCHVSQHVAQELCKNCTISMFVLRGAWMCLAKGDIFAPPCWPMPKGQHTHSSDSVARQGGKGQPSTSCLGSGNEHVGQCPAQFLLQPWMPQLQLQIMSLKVLLFCQKLPDLIKYGWTLFIEQQQIPVVHYPPV